MSWCSPGPQVTVGYINAPEATARAFVQRPGGTGTWYRTGDHVRLDGEGLLHYVGRIDHQVKILGHRIEPGEVDEALMRVLGGGNAVTVPVVTNGTARLHTFIDVPADVPALMDRLRAELPVAYIPERIVVLAELPRNANGKWDRPRLIHMAQHGA
ncbi:MAG: AMP-binding protein [Flavobacteriales bacterium]